MLNVIRLTTRKCLTLPSQQKQTLTLSQSQFFNFCIESSFCQNQKIIPLALASMSLATFTTTANATSAMDTKCTTTKLLIGKVDRFNGVIIDSIKENVPPDEPFQQLLENSITVWTKQNRRAIWFKVYLTHSQWIPILVQNGFTYHHAQNDYVMLFNWLPKNEEPNIPQYAHTLVGVGAVVVNDNNEVLVVCEKYADRPQWKLPGGYVEPGENFVDAAIREVYEETNIHTNFRSMLAFRHGHGGQFNCSDLYTVVSLKPLSDDIQKCEREIQDCKWMPIEEYLQHPDIHELNRLFVHKYIDNQRKHLKIDCQHGIHQVLKKPYTVYHAVVDDSTNENTACNKL